MNNLYYSNCETKLLICFCISLFLSFLSKAQCGLDPVTGTTTITTAGQIVNSYYPGQGNPLATTTSLMVGSIDGRGNATALAAGDLILIIQCRERILTPLIPIIMEMA
ncbi:MAG: hypothetical protein WDN26_16815 [Chitinophagaceae bacterium]